MAFQAATTIRNQWPPADPYLRACRVPLNVSIRGRASPRRYAQRRQSGPVPQFGSRAETPHPRTAVDSPTKMMFVGCPRVCRADAQSNSVCSPFSIPEVYVPAAVPLNLQKSLAVLRALTD